MLALKQRSESISTELILNNKLTLSRFMFAMRMLFGTLCAGTCHMFGEGGGREGTKASHN